jgi:hypothetical protein
VPRISQWFFGGGREQDGLPTLVLLDIEGTLVQTLSWRLGERDGIVPGREGCKVQASQSGQDCRAFQEVSATHGGDFPSLAKWSTAIYVNGHQISTALHWIALDSPVREDSCSGVDPAEFISILRLLSFTVPLLSV